MTAAAIIAMAAAKTTACVAAADQGTRSTTRNAS
jgi:hypothetical protein